MEETKPWWQSKVVWAGVVGVLIAAWNAAVVPFGLPEIPEWAYAILAAFGIYFRTTATKAIG